MPRSLSSLTASIYLFPLACDQPLTDTFQPISSTSLYVPGFLLDYYNRAGGVVFAAELRGVELVVVPVDTDGNPIAQQVLLSMVQADQTTIKRQVSKPQDISAYLRNIQDLVISCYGRISPQQVGAPGGDTSPIARYVTLVLLLGSLPTTGQQ